MNSAHFFEYRTQCIRGNILFGLTGGGAIFIFRRYCSKGLLVEFTNSMGRSLSLGNSITEAGFMDGSSCITCHARAGINLNNNQANFFRLSVFTKNLSDYGYSLSADSIPNQAWFHHDDNSGSLDVLQTDFVWGFFNANPVVKP